MTLRIGIDATCWANGRGYGRFTRELVGAMVRQAPGDEFVCFVDARAQAAFTLRSPNLRTVLVNQRVSPTEAAAAGSSRSPADMLRLTMAVAGERPDVFYCPSVYSYFPLAPGQRAVITIHDAIVERFPQLTVPGRTARLFWTAKVRLAVAQARLVLTVSDYAADEVAEMLRVPRSRLRVAVEAPADSYRQPSDDTAIAEAARSIGLPIGARWLIYVGGFNPHKHVDLLVRAFATAAGNETPVFLVLVGAPSDGFHGAQDAIHRAIDETGTTDRIRWTGFLSDDTLRLLHAGAVALVLPSASEGFGLPAIEAAAAGAPVIATTASPLPQLLRGGGVFIEPGSIEPITDAIRYMLTDEPARLAMARIARQRATALTWDATARSALETLREAAA